MSETGYFVADGKIWKAQFEEGKMISKPEAATAEEATPWLIEAFLEHPENERENKEFGEEVIFAAYREALGKFEGKPPGEVGKFLHQLFGDNPRIIELTKKQLSESVASQIWGGDKLEIYKKNDSPPPEVIPPANVIPTNGQGKGPTDSPSKNGGDPLILCSGQFFHKVTDLQVNGRGLDFEFARTYLHQTRYKGPLGYCWDHNYNLWLREDYETLPDGTRQNVIYRSTGGVREDKYTQVLETRTGELPPLSEFRDATFQAPLGFFDRLEKNGDLYFFETVTGLRFEYNRDLYIDRIVDLNGNQILFKYNTDKLLTKIIDPVGKEFLLGYNEMNRIQTLYDKTGNRTIRYYYSDNSDLQEVDFFFEPDLMAGTDYRYLGPDYPSELQHNLTEIINPMGQSVLENEYGIFVGTREYDKVVRQRSLDGEYRYEYGPILDSYTDDRAAYDPINEPQTFTHVFYPNDHSVRHWFNSQGNVVRRSEQIISDKTGLPEEIVTSYRYNEDALLIEEIRPDGSSVKYHYQREEYAKIHGGDASGATPSDWLAFGNLLKVIELPKTDYRETRRIVTDCTYTTKGNRLESRRGPYYADERMNPLPKQNISEVSYEYDLQGNLKIIGYPDVKLPDGKIQHLEPQEFHYDKYGQVTESIMGPLLIVYRYFPDKMRSGFVMELIEDADGVKRYLHYDVDLLGRIKQITGNYGDVTDIQWTTFDTPKKITQPEIVTGSPRPNIFYKYNRNRDVIEIREDLKLYDGTPLPNNPLLKTYRYDDYGRLIEHGLETEDAPGSRKQKTMFTPFNLPEKNVDALGNVTFIKYDERMLLSSTTRGWGTKEKSTTRIEYDTLANPIKIIDALGFKSRIKYDAFGRQHILYDRDDNELEAQYDAAGRVILLRLYGLHPETRKRVRWSEVDFKHDAAGRLIEKIQHFFIPGGSKSSDTLLRTQFFYDALNRLENAIDPTGAKYYYVHDGRNRLRSVQDSDGNERKWNFDDISHTMTIIDKDVGLDDSGSLLTQFFQRVIELDPRNLPLKEIDSLGNTIKRRFDSRQLLNYLEDTSGQVFINDYDIYGQLIALRRQLDGHEILTTMFYYDNGNLKSVITPVKGHISWTYDALNRVKTIERNGSLVSYVYDGEDNIIAQDDSNGIAIRYRYTPEGQLRNVEPDMRKFSPPSDAPSYTPSLTLSSDYKYTPPGQVAIATNEVATGVIQYDSLGRIRTERIDDRSVSYRYDNAGRRIGLIFPNGRDITFRRSTTGHLIDIIQNSTGFNYPGDLTLPSSRTLASITRIGNRPLTLRFGTSHVGKFQYDSGRYNVATDWKRISDGKLISQERNLRGNRGEWRMHQSSSMSRIFEYDKLSRLVNATDYRGIALVDVTTISPSLSEPGLATANNQLDIDSLFESIKSKLSDRLVEYRFDYTLDNNDNRLNTKELVKSTAPATVITDYVPDSRDMYQFIRGAKVVYDRMGNMLNDGFNSYRYDAYNRLAEVKTLSGNIKLFRDAISRLIRSKSADGRNIEDFVYAGMDLIEWRRNGVLEGHLVPLERPHQYAHLARNKIDYAPIFNVMGSPLEWLTSSVTATSFYDPFGQLLERSPDWPAPLGFAGYFYDDTTKLYNLPARTYEPRLGRFLQQDPAGLVDGTNSYAYVHHAPGTLVDILGLSSSLTDTDWANKVFKGSDPLATPETGTFGTAGGALSQTGPAVERFIWNHPFTNEGFRGSRRGFILQNLYTNNPRIWEKDNIQYFDYEPLRQNKVQQIKSTDSIKSKYVGQFTRDATEAASNAITANPTGTMAGKSPQAVMITTTDAPSSVGDAIDGALARGRKHIPHNPLPPEHVRGLPGRVGIVGRFMTNVGFIFSAFALGQDIANRDVPMGIGNALGTVGGGLELYAIANAGAIVARGVTAMTAGLVVGGLGIAVTSSVSMVRAHRAGDIAGTVAGAAGVGSGLAIAGGAIGISAGIAGAPILLAGGIVVGVGVGIFHAGRYLQWW